MPSQHAVFRVVVACAGLVPVAAGFAGALTDFCLLDGRCAEHDPLLRSHFRYLSGLLLGIGLAFWTTLRRPEAHTGRYRLLTAIVVLGGLCRLGYFIAPGAAPHAADLFSLVMELGVTPLICLWQGRLAARTDQDAPPR